jgi:hypothetical protein
MARLGWLLGAVTVLALAVTATGFGVKVEPHEETCFHDDLKVRTQQRYTHTHTHTHTHTALSLVSSLPRNTHCSAALADHEGGAVCCFCCAHARGCDNVTA